ncbi:MAG: hypothetical protein NC209_05490 [Alistipes sp.]|nr:hypothetical protein [Alistipes senegalensis]MCM1250578.1 hypothetical protein [Alistipes sp.]
MKKIFSFVIAMAAVAMVGCCGNTTKKAAEGEAAQTVIEASAEGENGCCGKCCEGEEKCDSTCCDKCGEGEAAAE